MEPRLALARTRQFGRWYESLPDVDRTRVDARLDEMSCGRFGDSRSLGRGLFELKWKNGLRVYYSRARVAGVDVLALWGGYKGSQSRDIEKARRLRERYENEVEEDER
jgi:putative addiction module killer protein